MKLIVSVVAIAISVHLDFVCNFDLLFPTEHTHIHTCAYTKAGDLPMIEFQSQERWEKYDISLNVVDFHSELAILHKESLNHPCQ